MGSRYAQRPYSSGERSDLAERVVRVNRVAKVVKGGRKFSFSALIVVGDMNGRVGSGIGKAREVTEAIRKGMEVAKRNMITVPMVGTTIPHEVRLKLGSARIMLKPAAPGTGVISGGSSCAPRSRSPTSAARTSSRWSAAAWRTRTGGLTARSPPRRPPQPRRSSDRAQREGWERQNPPRSRGWWGRQNPPRSRGGRRAKRVGWGR
ncbi:MAG: hypothetical protein E6J30_09720 [Chloroflexi bacterium]|nr:MAG: hypothetical protein E6J30_09720 [Chloroflexota bacterium]